MDWNAAVPRSSTHCCQCCQDLKNRLDKYTAAQKALTETPGVADAQVDAEMSKLEKIIDDLQNQHLGCDHRYNELSAENALC